MGGRPGSPQGAVSFCGFIGTFQFWPLKMVFMMANMIMKMESMLTTVVVVVVVVADSRLAFNSPGQFCFVMIFPTAKGVVSFLACSLLFLALSLSLSLLLVAALFRYFVF